MKKINWEIVQNYAELVFGIALSSLSFGSMVVYIWTYLRDGVIEVHSSGEFIWTFALTPCLVVGIAAIVDAIKHIYGKRKAKKPIDPMTVMILAAIKDAKTIKLEDFDKEFNYEVERIDKVQEPIVIMD